MTGTPPDPRPGSADHRLNALDDALLAELTAHLDVEAGLRDVLLHAHSADSARTLGRLLDIEAGLAAILPTRPQLPRLPAPRPGSGHRSLPLLRTLSAPDRLVLRNDLVLAVAALALELDLARAHTHDLDLGLASALALDRTHALARALNHTRTLARDLAHDLDRAHDLAHDLNETLAQNLALDHTLAHNLSRDDNLARVRARARALDLALDLAHEHACAIDLDLAHNLNLNLNHARAFDDLNSARSRAHDHAHALAQDLDIGYNRDLTPLLMRQAAVRISETVHRAVTAADVPELLVEGAAGAFDDFTDADLSNADLSNTDLSGIRWTQATRWPESLDTDQLRRASREDGPGSGVWVVVGDGDTIPDHVLAF
jgi:hypothetical protein